MKTMGVNLVAFEKANELVRSIGWDHAVMIVEKALHIGMFKFLYIGKVNSEDLEHLVDSRKLLKAYGCDKDSFIANYCQDRKLDPQLNDVYTMVEREYNQAMNDMASCMGCA